MIIQPSFEKPKLQSKYKLHLLTTSVILTQSHKTNSALKKPNLSLNDLTDRNFNFDKHRIVMIQIEVIRNEVIWDWLSIFRID